MKEIPKFIMVVGVPGSGKSYFLEQNFSNFHIHSSDKIRGELLENESDQSNNSLIFETLHQRVKEDLKNKISCCFDATNTNSKRRKAFLQELKNIPCEKICYIVATPVELCIENDKHRERQVGEEVINKFYRNFNIPTLREGWDNIKITYNFDSLGYYDSKELLDRLEKIEQHNPHHSETIGKHCEICYQNVKNDSRFLQLDRFNQDILEQAALFHDIGKEHTATFENKKGEVTEICHYYDHENVGAYKSLFLDIHKEGSSCEKVLAIADLIQLHMKLYSNPDSERYRAKLHRQLGDELYNMLEILHEADKNAK